MNYIKSIIFALVILTSVSFSQTVFKCNIDGDEFIAKNIEATQIKMLNTDYIQIRIDNNKGNLIFLYLKLEKLRNEIPVTLKYNEPQENQIPDVELIFAPNPEEPQWNSIKGEAEITNFDEANKTISGKFEFVIEKMEYGTKKKKPKLDVEDGIFTNVVYKVEETTN